MCFLSYRKNIPVTQKRVRISHGKRGIGVRVIEVWLHIYLSPEKCSFQMDAI